MSYQKVDGSNTQGLLRSLITRVETMEEEKKNCSDDIREIYKEVKAAGFDTKIVRLIIRRRKMDANERDEQDALVETYENNL